MTPTVRACRLLILRSARQRHHQHRHHGTLLSSQSHTVCNLSYGLPDNDGTTLHNNKNPPTMTPTRHFSLLRDQYPPPKPIPDDDDDNDPDSSDPFLSLLSQKESTRAAAEEAEKARLYEETRKITSDELDSRTGRLWSDPLAISDDMFAAGLVDTDLPDWTADCVSKMSLDMVLVLEQGVPTLKELTGLALPPPSVPHPAHDPRRYMAHFKKMEYERIYEEVVVLASQRLPKIVSVEDLDEKQDKIDELYEWVEETLMEKEGVRLGHRLNFGKVVEKALENFLVEVNEREENMWNKSTEENSSSDSSSSDSSSSSSSSDDEDLENGESSSPPSKKRPYFIPKEIDDASLPPFMDMLNKGKDEDSTESPEDYFAVTGAAGGMTEEWELSANKSTKRIMLRRCIRNVARLLQSHDGVRIVLKGRKGVGKSAAINAIVASARKSDHIVLFYPSGDKLAKRGYYVEPSPAFPGKFDIPNHAQMACKQLLECHERQIQSISKETASVQKHFGQEVWDTVLKENEDFKTEADSGTISLLTLLEIGADDQSMASGTMSLAIQHFIQNQEEQPFLMVIDEINSFFSRGWYYHQDYDPDTVKTIPNHLITLFEPFIAPLSPADSIDPSDNDQLFKTCKILTATTHTRAVPTKHTEDFIDRMDETAGIWTVDVPRYSNLECKTVLANYECCGVGKLRLDMGETIGDELEVKYLEMLSGGIGRELLEGSLCD